MSRSLAFCVQCVVFVSLVLGLTARAQRPETCAAVAEIFARGYQNGDKTLSQKEYETLRGTTPDVRRDFIVFDLNTDQALSEDEIHSIPSVGGEKRGSMPAAHWSKPSFAWQPKGDRIIYSMLCAERGYTHLYEFNPAKTELPTLVAGQDVAGNNSDVCWTPDGQHLIIVSGDF